MNSTSIYAKPNEKRCLLKDKFVELLFSVERDANEVAFWFQTYFQNQDKRDIEKIYSQADDVLERIAMKNTMIERIQEIKFFYEKEIIPEDSNFSQTEQTLSIIWNAIITKSDGFPSRIFDENNYELAENTDSFNYIVSTLSKSDLLEVINNLNSSINLDLKSVFKIPEIYETVNDENDDNDDIYQNDGNGYFEKEDKKNEFKIPKEVADYYDGIVCVPNLAISIKNLKKNYQTFIEKVPQINKEEEEIIAKEKEKENLAKQQKDESENNKINSINANPLNECSLSNSNEANESKSDDNNKISLTNSNPENNNNLGNSNNKDIDTEKIVDISFDPTEVEEFRRATTKNRKKTPSSSPVSKTMNNSIISPSSSRKVDYDINSFINKNNNQIKDDTNINNNFIDNNDNIKLNNINNDNNINNHLSFNELEEMKKVIEVFKKEIQNLETKLDDSEKENCFLLKGNNEFFEKNEMLEKQIKDYLKINENSKKKIEEISDENNSLLTSLEQIQIQLKDSEMKDQQIKQLEKENEEKEKTIIELKQTYSFSNSSSSSPSPSVSLKTTNISSDKDEIIEKLKAENRDLQKKLSDLTFNNPYTAQNAFQQPTPFGSLPANDQKLDELSEKVIELQAKENNYLSQIDTLRKKIIKQDKIDERIKYVIDRNEILKEEKEAFKQRFTDLIDSVDFIKDKNLLGENVDLNNKIKKIEEQNILLQQYINSNDPISQYLNSLSGDTKTLKNEIYVLKRQIESLKQTLENKDKKFNNIYLKYEYIKNKLDKKEKKSE